MSKRFTDTEKWQDPWYRKLKPEEKNFWDYICCQCDNSGVWKPDLEVASFYIGFFIKESVLTSINQDKERVVILSNGYWLIKEFIDFQHGHKINNPNVRKHITKLIDKHNRYGYPLDTHLMPTITGIDTPKGKGIGKGKGKGKGIGIGKNEEKPIENKKSPVHIAYEDFISKYELLTKSIFVPAYGKHCKLLKTVVEKIGRETYLQAVDKFFESKEGETVKFSFDYFIATINKWIIQ